AFQYRFVEGGKFDMVIYDSETNSCSIFEVKHSDKATKDQTKYLNNAEKCATVERIYGKIIEKYVLYRGRTRRVGTINYINVEDYLMNLD
ncbi:MAG: ATP-binding protein, partial [Clostridia bacterium]|nr:ATP-binding protein [Clostridia bacterium]